MVVKPTVFVATGRRGLVQPAIKCRSREYLRIIYSPESTMPENLERLRSRGLSTKRHWPCGSLHWVWRGCSFSLTGSRCTAFTSAPLECWPWKGSRLTRGCEPLTLSLRFCLLLRGQCCSGTPIGVAGSRAALISPNPPKRWALALTPGLMRKGRRTGQARLQ